MKTSFYKRVFDVVFSSLFLLILFPFILIILFVAWLETKQFPIYTQQRGLSLEKNLFTIFKVRTIKKHSCTSPNEQVFFKPYYADFVPPFCRWLRKTGLDELPQLFNILRGDMSFVGPRPFSQEDLEIMKAHFSVVYSVRSNFSIQPGLTGTWQLYGDRNAGMKNLIHWDNYYVSHSSFFLDTKILFNTIPYIFFALHSDAIIEKKSSTKFSAIFISQD